MKVFRNKISYDDSLDDISRSVSNEAMRMARDEMSEKITENPQVTTVDYRSGNKEVKLDTPFGTPSGKDPYDMYGKVGDNGVISASRITPKRAHMVEEIDMGGMKKLSTREDFEKKVEKQSVTEDEKTELSRIVRVSSENADAYANSESRSASAYAAFDSNKYKIEEAAGRTGLPPSLLSSVYFKAVADNGSITADAPSVRYAKLAYHRLYGKPLGWDDKTLGEYLATPDGALDFIAICLKSEAKYLGYNPAILTKGQMSDLLSGYGKWTNQDLGFEGAVMEYNSVFDGIYRKLPSKDYEIRLT